MLICKSDRDTDNLLSIIDMNWSATVIVCKYTLPLVKSKDIALDFIVIPLSCSSSRLSIYLNYKNQNKLVKKSPHLKPQFLCSILQLIYIESMHQGYLCCRWVIYLIHLIPVKKILGRGFTDTLLLIKGGGGRGNRANEKVGGVGWV